MDPATGLVTKKTRSSGTNVIESMTTVSCVGLTVKSGMPTVTVNGVVLRTSMGPGAN